jgi:hypothetical protein
LCRLGSGGGRADQVRWRKARAAAVTLVETVIWRDPWDVDRRLAELGLGSSARARLLKVRSIAISAGADATPFHPANAPGTFSYHHGTFALRNEFVGDDWQLDRPDGVEAIRNEATQVKVVFANVDVAHNDHQKPKPRSRKGTGAERVCCGNLFGSLPEFAPRQPAGWATYYLMVDESGAAELTRPVVSNGTFASYIERIYLSDGSDIERDPVALDGGDAPDEFDPQVLRK